MYPTRLPWKVTYKGTPRYPLLQIVSPMVSTQLLDHHTHQRCSVSFRKEVHVRNLKIRLVSQGVVCVHCVYVGSLSIFWVCFLVIHHGTTLYLYIYVCLYHLSERNSDVTPGVIDLIFTDFIFRHSCSVTFSILTLPFLCSTSNKRNSQLSHHDNIDTNCDNHDRRLTEFIVTYIDDRLYHH